MPHTRHICMRASGTPMFTRLAVTVVAGPMLLAGLSACSSGHDGSASCAAVIVYDGHTYLGNGGVKRDPEVTGRSMPAVLPSCDDTGGQSEADKDESVRVVELADVAASTAVFFQGAIYVRDGRDLPKQTQRWFRAPQCGTDGTFELTGDWLGVTGPKQARFDGDIRLPYRLEVHVTSGPTRFVGTTILVRATEATDPALTSADVKASLWQGGQVTASVQCADRHFEALSLHT
jgi:hypothetical protein